MVTKKVPKSIKQESPEVLIVGAGPTGLTMAIELARHEIPFRIIDKAATASETSKALALQARTMEVFFDMGVLQKIFNKGHPVARLNGYINGRPRMQLSLRDGVNSPFSYVMIFPQSETEQILTEKLQTLGHEIEREVTLEDLTQGIDEVEVTLKAKGRKSTIKPRWVIGCDGAHSTVRHAVDLPFKGSDYTEEFMLADAKIDWKLSKSVVNLFVKPEGLLAVIPMKDDYARIITLNVDKEGQSKVTPTLSLFQEKLDLYCPVEATLSDPQWMSDFKLQRRMVPKMRVGRVFLAGDAAHIHSPIGGQGMNTGIQDAYNLAWKLALYIHGKVREEFIDSYNAERLPVASHVLHGTNAAMKTLLVKDPYLQKVRNVVAPLLMNLPLVKSHLQAAIAETSVSYCYSPIVDHPTENLAHIKSWIKACFKKGVQVGDRALDSHLLEPKEHKKGRLFNLLQGTNHTLLLFLGEEPQKIKDYSDKVKKLDKEFSGILQAYLIAGEHSIDYNLVDDKLYNLFIDKDGIGHRKYGCEKPSIFLIRPDGYCAFRGGIEDIHNLRYYIHRHFLNLQ